MKASHLFFPTLRDVPSEAEMLSHRLLLRGGFIRHVAAGVYSYLPLGWRVHTKIARIVREEMGLIGGQEVHMPVLVPRELLDETGRSEVPVLFRLKDRNQRDFVLGFTHEEVITDIVRTSVRSWKQMPLHLYQIQTKERDEPRPRGGLLRGREFTMYDGYSFDATEEGLGKVYEANYQAFGRVFERCGLEYLAVEADPGAIGGGDNHEFMVLTEGGEDTVLRCDRCGYAANAERAEVLAPEESRVAEDLREPQIVSTPGVTTVEQLCAFLNLPPDRVIKTLLCKADGRLVAGLVRGDRELNLPKFARLLAVAKLEMVDAASVAQATGAPVGFAGPVGLAPEVPIYVDKDLRQGANYVVGANQPDAHRVDVTPGRDFSPTAYGDIRTAVAGDVCPRCGQGNLQEARGIEVGHIFKLGDKYSRAMGALFQNELGEQKAILMGCYGLGISRTLAAAVEAHHDENGIIWPISIAPFEVAIIVTNMKEELQQRISQDLYARLQARYIDVLIDDRDERAGVKFKDMDLIGVPIQVVVGKGALDGVVEVGRRGSGRERDLVAIQEAAQHIQQIVNSGQ